jgi:hypothetical protein
MSGKRYGNLQANPIQPVLVELLVMREDADGERQPEWHEFLMRPQADAGDLVRITSPSEDGGEKMAVILSMIRKMAANNDGLPAGWEPQALPEPDGMGDDWVEKFRTPSGDLCPMDQAGKFMATAKWSSRRRMLHLVMDDDTAAVELTDLAEIMKDMISLASNRPTTGPSRS